MNVKQMILSDCEKTHGLLEKLAKLGGYNDGGALGKVLRKDMDKDIEKIDGFIKIIEFMYPEQAAGLIMDLARASHPNKITCRLLLEYATLYHIYPLKELLIDKISASKRAEANEWAYVYSIDHQIATKEIDYLEGIKQLNKRSYISLEMQVYSQIAQMYCYYDMRNIIMLNLMLEDLEKKVEGISNTFIRNSFLGRVFRIKVDISLHNGKIGDLLESLFIIEKAPSPTKSMVHLQVGNSYMMKSYDKAMEHFNIAWEHRNRRTEYEIRQSINFTNLLWGHHRKFVTDGTMSNDLFYYIQAGNYKQAYLVVDKIDFEGLTSHQKGFHCYYRGILTKDETWFYKSIKYFTEAGEKFYKQIPIMELRKIGVRESVLEALAA